MLHTPKTSLTEKELAQRWSMSVKTLQARRQQGQPPAYIKILRSVRYPIKIIEAYEADSLRSSTAQYSAHKSGAA